MEQDKSEIIPFEDTGKFVQRIFWLLVKRIESGDCKVGEIAKCIFTVEQLLLSSFQGELNNPVLPLDQDKLNLYMEKRIKEIHKMIGDSSLVHMGDPESKAIDDLIDESKNINLDEKEND